jgi:hypothetical protein
MLKLMMFIDLTRPLVYALAALLWSTSCVFLFRRFRRTRDSTILMLSIACLVSALAMAVWLPISLQTDWHMMRWPGSVNRPLYTFVGCCFIIEVVLYPWAYIRLALSDRRKTPVASSTHST